MRKSIENNTDKIKKSLALVLAFIMFTASAFGHFAGLEVKAADTNPIPSNVTFEDLGQTAGAVQLEAANKVNTALGQVGSVDNGFKILVTNPYSVTQRTGNLIILGLYNTKGTSVWADGYNLRLTARPNKNDILFELRDKSGAQPKSGVISDVTDGKDLLVHVWFEGTDTTTGNALMHVVVNGQHIINGVCASSAITTGLYMNFWNELGDTIEAKMDVTFENLAQTAGVNSVAAPQKGTALGTVSNQNVGFQCLVPNPLYYTANSAYYLGLYTTKANDAWKGFCLRLTRYTNTSIRVQDSNNSNQKLADLTLSAADEVIPLYAWLTTDTDGTTPLLNVILGGVCIVKNLKTTKTTGTYMCTYSDYKDPILFQSMTQIADSNAVPTDVTFEDLGQTVGLNVVEAPTKASVLGQVSSQTTGFQCWVPNPLAYTENAAYYIGLYTTKPNDAWAGFTLKLYRHSNTTIKYEIKDGNTNLVASTITPVAPLDDEIMLYAWLTLDADDTPMLNVILDGNRIATNVKTSRTTGTYMCTYSDYTDLIVFKTIVQVEEPSNEVPTDVTFEDLGQIAKVNKMKVANKTTVGLGEVSSETTGFKFYVTHPGSVEVSREKQYYLGLYNTKADPWKGGYVLRVKYVSEDKLQWEVLANVIEGDKMMMKLIIGGQLADISTDTVLVYAWLKGTDETTGNPLLNIIIDGRRVVADATTRDYTLTFGKHMSAHNALCDMIEIKTITELIKENSQPPADVKFEDLSQTSETNSVIVKNETGDRLGRVSSKDTGFKFYMTHPGSIEVSGEKRYYVGLYNTKADPWKGGYALRISYVSDDTLKWEVMANVIENNKMAMKAIASGQLTDITAEQILVYAWIGGTDAATGNSLLNVIIDNTSIVKNVTISGYEVATGTYMSAHNAIGGTIVFETITPYLEPSGKVPTDVKFEDLGQMVVMNSVKAPNKKTITMGQVSSESVGFKFYVTNPCSVEPSGEKRYYVGLYNTKADPWKGGYALRISYVSEDTVKWEAFANTIQSGKMVSELIKSGLLTGISDDKLLVHVWLSGKDEAIGNPMLNMIINNKRLLVDKTVKEHTVTIGKYMSAHNALGDIIVFDSISKVSLLPSGVIFEDLGKTRRENTVTVAHKKGGDLGEVSSVKNGFVAKIPKPGSLETYGEKRYYIGLYNTKKADPWKSGYALRISQGSSQDAIRWELFANASGSKLMASGEVSGITGDEAMLYVWLNGTDKETKNPLLNVILGDTRIVKDVTVSDAVVVVGRYMSIYNAIADEIEVNTITRIVTLREKYMAKFGNVTDPDYIAVYDTSALDKLEQEEQSDTEEKKDSLAQAIVDKITNSAIVKELFGEEADSSTVLFVIGGVAVLLVAAGTVTGVILLKRKKKKMQSDEIGSVNEE